MVATSSASGKTLCYNIPVLEAMVTEKSCRALYLFPTKALAQDQLRNLRQPVLPGSDGSLTSAIPLMAIRLKTERSEIKKNARILIYQSGYAAHRHSAQSPVLVALAAPSEICGGG